MRELGAQSISAQSKLDMAHMKQLGGQSSAYKFGVLTKIVRHMKHRHMNGEDQPLTLEEILDETRHCGSPFGFGRLLITVTGSC